MFRKKHPLELLHPRSLAKLSTQLQELINRRLWLKILVALLLGVGTGILLGPTTGWLHPDTSSIIGNWLAIPGKIFLGLIQMIVVPLVFASIIRGLAASDSMEQLKQIGIRLVIYFMITTTIAITIGIGVALLIQPGNYLDTTQIELPADIDTPDIGNGVDQPTLGSLPDIVTGLLPINPLGAMVERQMLQVVIFAIIIGLALVSLPSKHSQPLLELLASLQEVTMTVVKWAMLLAPVAVFGLIAQLTIKTGLDVLLGLAVYVATVLTALLILLLFYLMVYYFVTRQSPLTYLGNIREVQLLAFSTSSTAAVMPLSIQTAEEKLNVCPSISQFIVPLGATINMDGTALYQGAATVFLAQVYGIELSLAALLLVVVTTVAASIGSPATPGVGIIILAMVLGSVGIPASGVALIIGVDRILDMSRTAINVTGDLTATVVMNRWIGGSSETEEENC